VGGVMTVGELIEILSRLPRGTPVVVEVNPESAEAVDAVVRVTPMAQCEERATSSGHSVRYWAPAVDVGEVGGLLTVVVSGVAAHTSQSLDELVP